MKTALFFLGALIFAAFVQAEDSRITNFKKRSTKEDWLVQFEVKEADYTYCRTNQYDVCFSAGIYTPEITDLNQIIFKGFGYLSIGVKSEVAIMLQSVEQYSPNVFLPNALGQQFLFVNADGTQQQLSSVFHPALSITDPISGNYAILLISYFSGEYTFNKFWLYLPNLNNPEQGTNNDSDDSESRRSTLTAFITLLILAILL